MNTNSQSVLERPLGLDAEGIRQFAAQVRGHLFEHILPFWCGPALDHEQGGWQAWMSNDLQTDPSQPKGLIVNSRILWTFSAVYRAQPDVLYRQMAERAFDVVMNRFWDPQFGGAVWRLSGDGRVLDDAKKTYGQAFYIYALTEFHRAFNSPAAFTRAKELFSLIEEHAHDSDFGGYTEVCRRDWSAAADVRLSDKDMNEQKSMNNHLHVLEAYTNLYRVWKEPLVKQRIRELLGLFEQHILNPFTHHLNHFFDGEWQVRSDTYTFGHDIEASWLLLEAAEVLDDPTLVENFRQLAVRMAEVALREGISANGALCYEGRADSIIDARKECWPQAEAVVGFLNAFQLSGDAKFLNAAKRVWDYAEKNLADRVNGEWFWRVNESGRPDDLLPKVSEWKGPYHVSRACLETMRRLANFDHA